jgi:mono/diheme cytochrome c family protein
MSRGCVECHGNGLSGGTIPDGPPDWPPAANLTPGPGSVMPFVSLRELDDTDAQAVYACLKTAAPKPQGQR